MLRTLPRSATLFATAALTLGAPNAAHAGDCAAYVNGLITWVKSNADPSKDRYVWFVLASNQANQIVAYSSGRLSYVPGADALSGSGNAYLTRPSPSVSNQLHSITTTYAAPPAAPPKFDPPKPGALMSVKLSTASPKTLALSGTKVTQTQCADDVMYGWEDVPPGQNPQTYPKTFFTVSFNKMTAKKPPPPALIEIPQTPSVPKPPNTR